MLFGKYEIMESIVLIVHQAVSHSLTEDVNDAWDWEGCFWCLRLRRRIQ